MSDLPDRIAWIAVPAEEALLSDPSYKPPSAYDFGFVAGMTRLRLAHPRIGAALGALFREVMFVDGQLTRPEREMIAAIAAAAQDCHY